MQILFIMIIGKFTLPQTKILHACSQQKVVQVSKVLVAIFNSWRNVVVFFRPINVLQTVITWKKVRVFFSGIFEMSFDYEANVHLVYFSKKLLKNCLFQRNTAAIFLLSKYMVGIHTYTTKSPLNRGKLSEKDYLIRLWKEKFINIFVFVFWKRGTVKHIYMVLFIETCNQTWSSILWRGNEERLHFQPTLTTKKNTHWVKVDGLKNFGA